MRFRRTLALILVVLSSELTACSSSDEGDGGVSRFFDEYLRVAADFESYDQVESQDLHALVSGLEELEQPGDRGGVPAFRRGISEVG